MELEYEFKQSNSRHVLLNLTHNICQDCMGCQDCDAHVKHRISALRELTVNRGDKPSTLTSAC